MKFTFIFFLIFFVFSSLYSEELTLQEKMEVAKTDWDDVGFEFHELIWEKLDDNNWIRFKTINSTHLRTKNSERKWLLEIHSFDPVKGTAIVRVGEGDNTPIYSWYLLDIKNRCLVKKLQECTIAFEPYSG